MDDSDFQIEDPGSRIRKLPPRARKQLSGVSQVAPSDPNGEMSSANLAPLHASTEVPIEDPYPFVESPRDDSAEVPFENPAFRTSGEFPAAVSLSGDISPENPWRDSISEEIPSARPDGRPGDSSEEVRTARLSNSSGEMPAATLDKSGDPRAAGGRTDRNSKLQEQRSQSIERRRSSGEWKVSGEHRIPGDRPAPEEWQSSEDRRSAGERRSLVERRALDEFRIASEEHRKPGDRRSPSGERRQPYTETSPHIIQAGEQPEASGEYRAQPQEHIRDSSTERWTLLQEKRALPGERSTAPPTPEDRSPSQEPSSLTNERRNQPDARPPQERSSQPEKFRSSAPSSRFIGPFTITALSVLLIAYAFSYSTIQTAAETMVAGWNSPDQLEGNTLVAVAQRTIPYLVMLPPLLLLYGVLTSVASFIGLRRSKLQKERSKRGKISPLDRFKEQADSEGVLPRYAYQAYLLLEQHLPNGHELGIGDRLEDDLALSPAQVRTVRMSLLQNTDRAVDPDGRLAPVDTVLAMLLSAQQTPRRQRDLLAPVFVPGDPKTGRSR